MWIVKPDFCRTSGLVQGRGLAIICGQSRLLSGLCDMLRCFKVDGNDRGKQMVLILLWSSSKRINFGQRQGRFSGISEM